jgi:hypothetical protein
MNCSHHHLSGFYRGMYYMYHRTYMYREYRLLGFIIFVNSYYDLARVGKETNKQTGTKNVQIVMWFHAFIVLTSIQKSITQLEHVNI